MQTKLNRFLATILVTACSASFSGCAHLVIKHEDKAGKTTAKVVTRVILGAATLGISEFKIAEHRIYYKCSTGEYDSFQCNQALEEHRRLGAAIAAGLQGFSQGMQQAQYQQQQQQRYYPQQRARVYEPEVQACTSDYGCPYGSACVKDQFKSQGFCAKKVDSYGIQTFAPPNPSSVNVGGE